MSYKQKKKKTTETVDTWRYDAIVFLKQNKRSLAKRAECGSVLARLLQKL